MANVIVGQAPEIEVRITAVVERDYRRRDVFPKLRSEHALRMISGSVAVHILPIEEAEAVLNDADAQLSNRHLLQRGLPVAFGSLRAKLQAAVKHAKGLSDDPGPEVARQRMEASLARFQVGERARWYGCELEIVKGYGLHGVADEEGEYVRSDGKRGSYCFGYVAKDRLTGEHNFYSPHELQRIDYSPGHLRLVRDNTKRRAEPPLLSLRREF